MAAAAEHDEQAGRSHAAAASAGRAPAGEERQNTQGQGEEEQGEEGEEYGGRVEESEWIGRHGWVGGWWDGRDCREVSGLS